VITHKQLEDFILALPQARLDYPFGKDVAVYKASEKMFALIAEGSDPVRISLKCEPKLAEFLRDKYDTVMPGYHLNKKHWNTVVCSGQLDEQEIKDLIVHAHHLVTS
jgi:predicted DNA-binding protein (MmcQ/YjbR family)